MQCETVSDSAGYDAALALHMQGQTAEAAKAYEDFLSQTPEHVEALHGLGIVYLQSGDPDRAVQYLERAVHLGGGNVIRNNLGVALCAAGRLSEASKLYYAVVRTEPDNISAHYNLGKILNELHCFADAIDVLQQAIRVAPQDGRLHHQLALALSQHQKLPDALRHIEYACQLLPTRVDIKCDYAAILLKSDQPQTALDCYVAAHKMASQTPAPLCGMGEALGALGRHEEAISCFEKAIAVAPDLALPYYNCGTALTYVGKIAQAERMFSRAAELEPDNPTYRGARIALKKSNTHTDDLQALEEMAAHPDRMDPRVAMELQFTLAKAYDDINDFSHAAAALSRGSEAKRKLDPYSIITDLDRFSDITKTFTADFIATHADCGDTSDQPVFIIGMPRSGTTLVEQIIASHPNIYGAGEQPILGNIINAGALGENFPHNISDLHSQFWRSAGENYVQALQKKSPEAMRITDKLPLNFQLIGIIRIILPNARIIHVTRDPMDTCFSCYFTLFANGLGFTYNLEDLGHYYRGYQALMTHWRTILSPDIMLEVQYENIVADCETETRRMLDYCGVSWDARCLNFHKTDRSVETASTLQVRKPLYSASVGRAKQYAPWLEPLRRTLAGETE